MKSSSATWDETWKAEKVSAHSQSVQASYKSKKYKLGQRSTIFHLAH